MTETQLGRIVDIAENGRHLARERGFLTISHGDTELGRIPLDDLAAVIATAPGTTASCALLSELGTRGIPFVVCGTNYVPSALLWPVVGHHAQQRRIEGQVSATRAIAKRLWAEIIAAKLSRQGWALAKIGQPGAALVQLARMVRSGDPENLEAQGARRYWPLVFGRDFTRDIDGGGVNAQLNYGYAVLRAATARAIVAAGLHPGIGVFHRHPHNPMPLADDLMEPFRPAVDLIVRQLSLEGLGDVNTVVKRRLVSVLQQEELSPRGKSTLSNCLHGLAASLAESYLNRRAVLIFPKLTLPAAPDGAVDDHGQAK